MKKLFMCLFLCFFLLATTISLNAKAYSPDAENFKLDLSETSKNLATDDPIERKPAEDIKLRWAEDKVIYDGEVNTNSWAVMNGLDDDAIDVDYFAGDTLRAVVACADSIVRTFRSNDNGMTWELVNEIEFNFENVTEPKIVHGPDSTYHVFVRYLRDQGQIYTRAYMTSDDSYISGTGQYIAGDDSVKNYSVCTNRQSFNDYSVFLVYHYGIGGRGNDGIKFTKTDDLGHNWSTPSALQANGSGFPDLTYGNDNTLYETYIFLPGTAGNENVYSIYGRVSFDFGENWNTSELISSDTFPKMRPRIAAAYDGSGNVWTIWPKQNLLNEHDDWGLRWSWSTDSAETWSTPAWTNSYVDSNEVLPNIAVYDAYGSVSNTPYVSYVKMNYDWIGTVSIRQFYWLGDEWDSDTAFSDSSAFLTRPVTSFVNGGAPALAFVGENAEKVYFDSWTNTDEPGIDEITDPNEEILCSLDRNLIIGNAVLKYMLPERTNVDVSVVNILGQNVATLDSGEKEAGENTVNLSGENLSQGIYYIVIETANGLKGRIKATVLK